MKYLMVIMLVLFAGLSVAGPGYIAVVNSNGTARVSLYKTSNLNGDMQRELVSGRIPVEITETEYINSNANPYPVSGRLNYIAAKKISDAVKAASTNQAAAVWDTDVKVRTDATLNGKTKAQWIAAYTNAKASIAVSP